jgi:hypothetical protein
MNVKPIAAATLLAITALLAACGDQNKAPNVSNSPAPLVDSTAKPPLQATKPSPTPDGTPIASPAAPEPAPIAESPAPAEPASPPPAEPPAAPDAQAPAPDVPLRPAAPLPAKGDVKLGDIEYRNSETAPDAGIEQAIVENMGGDRAALANTRYYYDRIDLSGDGQPETLVYLNGAFSCGSGGCTMLVMEPQGNAYKVLSKMTLVHAPVIVSTEKTAGWNDLIISVSGGGAEAHYARMQFDGSKYPRNPTTAPEVAPNTTLNGTAVIGDDMTGNGGIAMRGG